MGSLEAPGARLRRLRLTVGLTQQQLAAKAGISYFTLSKIEQGVTKLPSAAVLFKLSGVLGFDLDEFLGKKSPRQPLKRPIKFVYSDIGGVLVHTESALFQPLSADLNRPLNQVKALYFLYVPFACRGKISMHDLQLLLMLKLHLKFKSIRRRRLFKHWVDYMQPIVEAHQFLSSIAKNFPTGLLTDTIDGFVERMQQRQLLPDLRYKTIVKSSDLGIMKPEAAIFAEATKRAGVKPAEILFIDDKKINVKGARAFGWQAEWFNELKPKASIARIKRKYF